MTTGNRQSAPNDSIHKHVYETVNTLDDHAATQLHTVTNAIIKHVCPICTGGVLYILLLSRRSGNEVSRWLLLKQTWLLGHSLEPRLSVPDFVSQLWRKIRAMRQNPEQKSLGSRLIRSYHTHA